MGRRWGKIEKDFNTKNKAFDISKIPDIYDCIKYDLQHNQHTLQFELAEELYICAKYLADIVIPQVEPVTKPSISFFYREFLHAGVWLEQAKQVDDRPRNLHAVAKKNQGWLAEEHWGVWRGKRQQTEPQIFARSLQSRSARSNASLLHEWEPRALAAHGAEIWRTAGCEFLAFDEIFCNLIINHLLILHPMPKNFAPSVCFIHIII